MSNEAIGALSGNEPLRQAKRWTVGFGWLAAILGGLFLVLGVLGGDGETSAIDWLIQGIVMAVIGTVQVYFGRQLIVSETSARKALKVLIWITVVSLALCVISLLMGDMSAVLPSLFALAFLQLYHKAKRSFDPSAVRAAPPA